MITISEYDSQWAVDFAELRERFEVALAGTPIIAIEHVGSTAVVGLAAKPVIDLDIVVARQDVDDAIAAMKAIGFVSRGEQGINDRWALQAPAGLPRTHTYVVVEGSLALRNHLAVRRVLQSDSDLRDRYAALKLHLASGTDDINAYIEGKSPLLAEILRRGGLSDGDIRRIVESNIGPQR